MDELKKKTMETINQINQDWVNEINEAEKENRGIDLSALMGNFSINVMKLDQYFLEAKARQNTKKKRW